MCGKSKSDIYCESTYTGKKSKIGEKNKSARSGGFTYIEEKSEIGGKNKSARSGGFTYIEGKSEIGEKNKSEMSGGLTYIEEKSKIGEKNKSDMSGGLTYIGKKSKIGEKLSLSRCHSHFAVTFAFRGDIRISLCYSCSIAALMSRCRAMHLRRNVPFGEQAPHRQFGSSCAPLVETRNFQFVVMRA